MILDAPRAIPDHAAQDDMAEFACPQPDMSCCSPEHLTPPDPPSKRLARLRTIGRYVLGLVIAAIIVTTTEAHRHVEAILDRLATLIVLSGVLTSWWVGAWLDAVSP